MSIGVGNHVRINSSSIKMNNDTVINIVIGIYINTINSGSIIIRISASTCISINVVIRSGILNCMNNRIDSIRISRSRIMLMRIRIWE